MDPKLAVQVQGGAAGAGLYEDTYGVGNAMGFAFGAEASTLSFILKVDEVKFKKIEKNSFAGRTTHENSIFTYRLDLEYKLAASLRLKLGYGQIKHTEKSYLYEELIPGTEQSSLQSGTLQTPEDLLSVGATYVLPLFSKFELHLETTYNRGLKNDLNLILLQSGLRYVFD